ncbi:TonB-dependent receptor [Sphingobacterium sp. NGMCC 1.201703]|uniref:TonB-dependent receptor n=1 Tax=Sphingobacterium sp. NGMCC 1.201703 TaxID=3388657 RepID=UPI0039FD753F
MKIIPGKEQNMFLIKTLLIMKFYLLLAFFGAVQAKTPVYSQKMNLHFKNSKVDLVLAEISKQAQLDLLYDSKLIKKASPVTLNLENATLNEALTALFRNQALEFEVIKKTLIIRPKETKAAARTSEVTENQKAINGSVKDQQGKPLAGVTVRVKNTQITTTSDGQGNFTIAPPSGSGQVILTFTYVGYENTERQTDNKGYLNVVLTLANNNLDDVVVVGYGTQKKINVTGAVSSVNMADMRTPVPNLSNALAGKVAGIISVQSSGEPGYDNSTFTIRGIGTYTGNSSPLIIIDGVQRDDVNGGFGGSFNNIDPEDISSISLLKDASSTAMYGAKGANGVLIITTKRGVAGKPKISFKAETGFSSFTKTPQMLDGIKYMELQNEARRNMGLNPVYTDELIQKTASGLDPYMYPNVNWIDEVYKKNSMLTNANINITGGGESVKYYISGSYYNQTGPYKVRNLNNYNPNLDFKRYDFRSNVDVNLSKTTSVQLNLTGMLVNSRYPGIAAGDLWYLAYATTPVAYPIQYPDGKWAGPLSGGGANPLNEVQNNGYSSEFKPIVQSVLTINQKLDAITEGLSAYARFSFDSYGEFNNRRSGKNDLWQATGRTPEGELIFNQSRVGQQFLDYSQESFGQRVMYLEGNLNYERTFNDHKIGGMFLYNMRNRLVSLSGSVIGSIPYRNQSLAGRINYGFRDKYLVEVNAGYTGSENFEKGQKFGLFPSASAGWVISNEEFFEPLKKTFSLLKIRGSYGIVGNDNIGDARNRFPYLTQIGDGGYTGFGLNGTWAGGKTERILGVENLTWERSYKTGIGLEIGLWNKLNLIFDGFAERRKNILIRRESISSIAGYNSLFVYANIGEMDNKGMDASIEYNDKFGDVGLRLFGNVTYSRNKIVFADEPVRRYGYQSKTGTRYGEYQGHIAMGYFTSKEEVESAPQQKFNPVSPGDIRYKNLNAEDDNIIDAYDRTYLGKSWFPSWLYGAGFSASYKNFDLSVFFQGVADVGIMANGSEIPGKGMGVNGVGVLPFSGLGIYPNNTMAIVEDRWTAENPRQDAYYPRLTMASGSDNNYINSTHWLKDGSYIRMKQASVGYNIKAKGLDKLGFTSLYVYSSGQNLLTFSKFKIWDPELGSNGAKYPLNRMITFGVRAQF